MHNYGGLCVCIIMGASHEVNLGVSLPGSHPTSLACQVAAGWLSP